MATYKVVCFFGFWAFLAICAVILNILNLDWSKTSTTRGIVITLMMFIIQGSVLEFPVMTVATLLAKGSRDKYVKHVSADHLTLVLNYNLLAVSKDDIDECLQTMYEAYMGNLSMNISAVLVSATNSETLRNYELETRDNFRALINDVLFREGLLYFEGFVDAIHAVRLRHIWSKYDEMDRHTFLDYHLREICKHVSRNFMVIHRVSRVLKKCGQYQDLMLLSAGDDKAYSYTDIKYYGRYARPYGQPLFHSSEDVKNIFCRHFDYTLVLDSDTQVKDGTAIKILEIAAAHPDKGIVQPAIKLHCVNSDTIFMHVERIRQSIYEPMTDAVTSVLGQSSYFGKALIKNSPYIEHVIGPRDNVLERVPVDVLSHDTFEAALLKPLYAGSVCLLEAPTYNYAAWNIRERRWNSGEVLLFTYFWKNVIGKPTRWLQRRFQGDAFVATKLRTESKLDFVSSYVAHSALRQMLMKPLLLAYILLHFRVHLHNRYISICVVMFLVMVFPKFATCTRDNYKFVLIETIASILQFTPEAVVGCVRVSKAMQAILCAKVSWIPQRAVEEEFRTSNPFISAVKHLWGYSAFSLVCLSLVGFFLSDALWIIMMLAPLFMLPIYTGFTSLTLNGTCTRQPASFEDEESLIGTGVPPRLNTHRTVPPNQKHVWRKYLHALAVCFFWDNNQVLKKLL